MQHAVSKNAGIALTMPTTMSRVGDDDDDKHEDDDSDENHDIDVVVYFQARRQSSNLTIAALYIITCDWF